MIRTAAIIGCAASAVSGKSLQTYVIDSVLEGDNTVTHGTTTVRVSDVPDDAPPHWPWDSVEDFFSTSGLSMADMTETGVQKCSSQDPDSTVYQISDGKADRCFVAITPKGAGKAAPVLFFAHGSGGSAYRCGSQPDLIGNTWVEEAKKDGFIMVCGEAVQQSAVNNITGATLHGGIWQLPEIFNDSTGRNCESKPGNEAAYMEAVWAKMDTMPSVFDTSRSFHHGCSEGSAHAQWQGTCRHDLDPSKITAFATHSTGLKVKGDGIKLPPCPYDPQYTWGECPTCKYWPTVPAKFDNLKACIFDNTADPNAQDPFFYKTSEQMAKYYKQFNSSYAESYGSGGHCVQHSFAKIAECMDDGSGRLIPGGSTPSPSVAPAPGTCTDTAPDTNYTCAQQKSFGKCTKPWMDGFCCKTCFDCDGKCSN